MLRLRQGKADHQLRAEGNRKRGGRRKEKGGEREREGGEGAHERRRREGGREGRPGWWASNQEERANAGRRTPKRSPETRDKTSPIFSCILVRIQGLEQLSDPVHSHMKRLGGSSGYRRQVKGLEVRGKLQFCGRAQSLWAKSASCM